MVSGVHLVHLLFPRWAAALVLLIAAGSLRAQPTAPDAASAPAAAPLEPLPPDQPISYDPDALALILARDYLKGGADGRAALVRALSLMGWSVRDLRGAVVHAAPAGADTGLAMRDYELDELMWNPTEQPSIRLISYAQAIAVPFEDVDPEELAQGLVDTLRKGAESAQPQQRFWARFILALGRVGAGNYDLIGPSPTPVLPLTLVEQREIEQQVRQNPMAMTQLLAPRPVWPEDDPVLAPSPKVKRPEGENRESVAERDMKRMNEISQEYIRISGEMASSDPAKREAAEKAMASLGTEMAAISQRQQTAMMQQLAASAQAVGGQDDDEDEDEEDDSGEPRFTAEWRDQPLSLLQVSLLTRVLAADLRLAAQRARPAGPSRVWLAPGRTLPLAVMGLAPVRAQAPSFGDQFSGAIGDIWATSWGYYTGEVLEHYLPENKFSKGVAVANTIIAWYKTIMSVVRQKITVTVEGEPLVRTKTRSPGEQRTARAKVEIDFPKHDALKALRAGLNLTTIDLQLPDGGPIGGAKVVWRLPEGSYNGKYQAADGGWTYRPDLAVVQFAQRGGKDAYVSTTNDKGEATITLEGVPQKKNLPPTVRPYPRRAVVSVEVTIKVGNLTQDVNDAINTMLGGPVAGGLGFIADMVLRTSFFFQAGRVFEVRDWKEPAWEGEFEIIAKASGSEYKKAEKGGKPTEYRWSMDRLMEGRLHTPEWAEEAEEARDYANDGRHRLEVDGDSRYFRLNDSSSAKTKDSHNRYEASGPLQIRPPAHNQLPLYSRSEPSGSATLTFNGGFMTLELQPFFGAECLVSRSEQANGRAVNTSAPAYLSLLEGIHPETFTIIEPNDGTQDYIEGTKTFDSLGSLPYVPNFDVSVTIKYRLWKNGPPPKNKR